jgi:hypothetical protein
LRALEQRMYRHGFDGRVHTDVSELPDALARAVLTRSPSLVIVDEPAFDATPGEVPVLIVDGDGGTRLISDGEGIADEVARRLNG